jgi:AraC-like DNA-binding protein
MDGTTVSDYNLPLISVRYVRRFIHFIEQRGIVADQFLQGSGLERTTLDDADQYLSMKQVCSLLRRARTLLNDERAPFEFGQAVDLNCHGLTGFAQLGQKDYRNLAAMIVQYLRVCVPIMDLEIHYDRASVRVRLVDVWDLGDLRHFVIKIYMGGIHALATLVSRTCFIEFDFPSEPGSAGWHLITGGAPVRFQGERNEVAIPLAGDGLLTPTSTERIEWAPEDNGMGDAMEMVMRVRCQVIERPGRESTLERVAQRLGMSTRSVRRHLALAGYSFSDIRSEVRQSVATRYLSESCLPLDAIAEWLGYSDQASFSKAYRAWTGTTPGEVRRRKRRR